MCFRIKLQSQLNGRLKHLENQRKDNLNISARLTDLALGKGASELKNS